MLVPCEVRHMNGLATGNYSRSVSKVGLGLGLLVVFLRGVIDRS